MDGPSRPLHEDQTRPGRRDPRGHDLPRTAVRTVLRSHAHRGHHLDRRQHQGGTVRADLDPSIVLRALGGMFYVDFGGDWQTVTRSLTDLLWTGMRDCSKCD